MQGQHAVHANLLTQKGESFRGCAPFAEQPFHSEVDVFANDGRAAQSRRQSGVEFRCLDPVVAAAFVTCNILTLKEL